MRAAVYIIVLILAIRVIVTVIPLLISIFILIPAFRSQ